MANTLGGFIVVGVSEPPTGFSWDGLTPFQLNSFDTSRVNRFLQNYADPPINASLRKVEDQGKHFVIIEVPRFTDTPHVCQKDFPGVLNVAAIYVRTDNNETSPLKSSRRFSPDRRAGRAQPRRHAAKFFPRDPHPRVAISSTGSPAFAIRKAARRGDQSLRKYRSA